MDTAFRFILVNMGKALYRSYRSKTFDEVVGQKHITETLKNSVKNGTYVHAYLLTGPRGVGKTSVARILAHAVNKADYPANPSHIDIIEIDAASNRRIDEIRELRERVTIAPTNLKYKVYIIDEVHMLTKEAFNALLKTLEEPPEHVIFILATTDVHKVPDTIVSRCVRFSFKPIPPGGIKKHLNSIAKSEKINITDEALELIATNSDGSFRDAIALLDQIRDIDEKIDANTVAAVLGLGNKELVEKVLNSVLSGEANQVLQSLEEAYEQGVSEKRLCGQLIKTLRGELLNPTLDLEAKQIIGMVDDLLDIEAHINPRMALEVALLKHTVDIGTKTPKIEPAGPKVDEGRKTEGKPAKPNLQVQDQPKHPGEKTTDSIWASALDSIKSENKNLYSIARMAKVEVIDGILVMKFRFAFHARQMDQAKNRQSITETLRKLGTDINKIEIKHSKDASAPAAEGNALEDISNIFGGSEVLES